MRVDTDTRSGRSGDVPACPRVVAPYLEHSSFVLCSQPLPCPDHGMPLFVIDQTDAGER